MAVARIDVIMPQMGESIAEGTVSKWLKKVGDTIKRDEPIFEISTDKVDAEIPSPSAGTLAEILVTEGQTVAVQTVVARLETEVGAAVAAAAPAAVAASASVAPAAPAAARPAAAVPAAPSHAAAGQAPSAPAVSGNGRTLEERLRTKSSPLVRKIAADHGIELSALTGSGVAGRVTKRDIEALLESGAPVPSVAKPVAAGSGAIAPPPAVSRPVHAVAGDGGPSLPMPEAWPGDVVEPMTKMRQLISDHMVVSRRTSAHVTSVFEVDLTRVARIRAKKQAEFSATSGQRLSYLPFIIRAVVEGLKAFPALNASVAGSNVIYRKQYNIGI